MLWQLCPKVKSIWNSLIKKVGAGTDEVLIKKKNTTTTIVTWLNKIWSIPTCFAYFLCIKRTSTWNDHVCLALHCLSKTKWIWMEFSIGSGWNSVWNLQNMLPQSHVSVISRTKINYSSLIWLINNHNQQTEFYNKNISMSPLLRELLVVMIPCGKSWNQNSCYLYHPSEAGRNIYRWLWWQTQ
jgi:hypothetical protein